MEKILGSSSSHDLPEPGNVKPHALHEEDVAERKAAKAQKSKEMLSEEAMKLDTAINGIDIQVRFSPTQKEYVLSFPGAKGNALEIGNSAANAREIFGRAVGLAAGQKGVEGVPNMMKKLQTLALELQAEPEEDVLVEEAPAATATVVEVAEDAPKKARENELDPGMREILDAERARQMKEGEDLFNRETATERGARILQERFLAIDEKLVTQDVALAARERTVQTKLGRFFAGAIGLTANAWDAAGTITKGLVKEGGGALIDVFKPTEGGAMRSFINFAFEDSLIGAAASLVGKEDQLNRAQQEGIEERLQQKIARQKEVLQAEAERAEAIAEMNKEKYGTATPGIRQRFSVWREDRAMKKEAMRISKEELAAAKLERAVELAQEYAARGGDVYTQEEAEVIGKKMLRDERISFVLGSVAEATLISEIPDIIRGNLLLMRLVSKLFTTERFAATNRIGAWADKALRTKDEQARFEESQEVSVDDERVLGWFARNVGSVLLEMGSLRTGGKVLNENGEPKELSAMERLFPTVFDIRNKMRLRNAEIQAKTLESGEQSKGRMRKAYEGVVLTINAAREGKISDEMLRNNPALVDNLREALRNLDDSHRAQMEEEIDPIDDIVDVEKTA